MAALSHTKLEYFTELRKLQSTSAIISTSQKCDGKKVLIMESTIFHPQGGAQPADTGVILSVDRSFKFVVEDVRAKGEVFEWLGYERW